MDAILGRRPATQPPVVVNSMDEVAGDTTGDTADDSTADTAGEYQPDERGNSSDQELDDIQPSGAGSSKDTPSSSHSGTPLAPQQRKRKRSKGDKNDASTTELISKLLKIQEESDRRLIQLEKCLEFEEQQLEKEAQQRKDEREFQLRMMQLMMGQAYGQPQPHYHPQGPFGGMQNGLSDHDPMCTFSPPETADN